jgi:ankyrin repeat protein
MAKLYDVAHFCSWNGYTEDMRSYLGVDTASWTNSEFWSPHGANLLYGPLKKSRIQIICGNIPRHDGNTYYRHDVVLAHHAHSMKRNYHPVARIQQLLADGANPDIRDVNGWSGLLICARDGWAEHLEIIKILLDAGADVNEKTVKYGSTPLLLAANNGHLSIVRELIRRGANVNALSKSGLTAIVYAAGNGHLDIVKELIAAGAIVDDEVFKEAIDGGQVVVLKYLMTLGQLPEDAVLTAVNNNQANIIRTLAKAGANMNFGFPVHNAIRPDAHDCLIALCAGGTDLNLVNNDNISPLTLAIQLGYHKAIKVLGEYKVNLNILEDDMSYLHHALMLYDVMDEDKNERRACIVEIINAGPDFKLVDRWGNTAAEYAEDRGMPEIVTLIKRAELKQRFLNGKVKGKK